jgi:tRNA(fMet)-specific endonuclease VapC
MTFILDSNAWIEHLRQTSPLVTARLRQHPAADVVLCSVVLGELLYGAEHSGPVHRPSNLAVIARLRGRYISLPFDDVAAEHYGPTRAYLASKGTRSDPTTS